MPVFTRNPLLTEGESIQTESTLGEAFGAGTYSMYEGLLGATGRREQLDYAEGNFGADLGGEYSIRRDLAKLEPLSPMLDPEVARQKLRDNGLDQNLSIPDSGIRQETLDILIDRKRDELRRQTIMAQSSGGSAVFANLSGALVGSFVDPTNIALAFVPVVGEARYAQMLSRAGGVLGRTGVRAGVGGLEGLVGLAPVEVLNYLAHQQQQSDYDAYDSMVAIAGGAFFGSALHGGAGLFSDFVLGGAKRFNQPAVVRNEPSLAGVIDQPSAPFVYQGKRDRLMVLDRLAEGRPVTRAQVDAQMPRTGAEAGQIIDDVLAELQAASRGVLPTERVRELVAESDELAAVMRTQEVAVRDGILLSPEGRLTPEEMGLADARRQAIKQELDAHGAAQSAAKQLEELDGKLAKIDSDADLIRLTEKLRPMADDIAFVESLSPAVRKELDADPFMPVRPFVSALDQKTQANAFRMAIAQAVSGRPVDISPALYADAAYFDPKSGFAAAQKNADLVDGADYEAATWASKEKPLDDDIEAARAQVAEEEATVREMMDQAGVRMNEDFDKAIKNAALQAQKQGSAAKAAAMCMMRTGG